MEDGQHFLEEAIRAYHIYEHAWIPINLFIVCVQRWADLANMGGEHFHDTKAFSHVKGGAAEFQMGAL